MNAIGLFGYTIKWRFLSLFCEYFPPITTIETKHGLIKWYTPGRTPHSRIDGYFIKETENFALIDSFPVGSVFWDVGANCGTYSMYAAKKGDVVIAFEPIAHNYNILTTNIQINFFEDNCTAYCIGLSDHHSFDYLYMQTLDIGKGGGTIGKTVNDRREYFLAEFRQGTLTFPPDGLISMGIPQPDYMKIDVDGLETEILNGAKDVLSNVKGLSIEINPHRADRTELIALIQSHGLKLDKIHGIAQNYIFYR